MRAIAARVLASPVRSQSISIYHTHFQVAIITFLSDATPATAPRGVVTAMTVPSLTEQLTKAGTPSTPPVDLAVLTNSGPNNTAPVVETS